MDDPQDSGFEQWCTYTRPSNYIGVWSQRYLHRTGWMGIEVYLLLPLRFTNNDIFQTRMPP